MRRWAGALAVLMALVLLLVGCTGPGGGGDGAAAGGAAGDGGIGTAPGGAQGSVPGSAPGDEEPLLALEMVDEREGWALSASRILRTADGGQTWRDVTPPGFVWPERLVFFFLDGQTGWVAGEGFSDVERRGWTPLVRTVDGGRTWEAGVIRGMDLKQIAFLDGSRGWALRHDGAATGGTELVTLLRTTDGGQSWVPMARAAPPGAPQEQPGPPPGDFPMSGMKTGVAFRDEQTGWATGWYTNVGALFFFRTRDGGVTWEAQELPVPQRLRENARRVPALRTEPARVFPGGRVLLPLSGLCGEENCLMLFHSEDGGETWRGTSPLPYDLGRQVVLAFADPDHGWAAVGAQVYATADGGEEWRQVASVEGVRHLDFVSPTKGWALGYEGLWRTEDGGRTWQAVPVRVIDR